MYKTDVCIIGAGASGLMCASHIKNKKTIILDKNDRIGKKILATGNGRCNLTNQNINSDFYNTSKVDKFFARFSNTDTLKYFETLGLNTFADSEGRVYPISNTATSVLDVLRLKINENNVTEMCNVTIKSLDKKNGMFYITLNDGTTILSEKVVLALGGNCDLSFIRNINIPEKEYTRSLTSLTTDINKGLNNIRVPNTKVTLHDNAGTFCQVGEVLFKTNSISGIVIFNLSARLARKKNFNGIVSLDFLYKISSDNVTEMLINRRRNMKNYEAEHFLTGLFHKALSINILQRCNIDLNKPVSKITDDEIYRLVKNIKDYQINIYEAGDNNQVFSGGIPLNEINDNFMLKNCKNLYAIGEMLDVDAECGGYNLQWAWTSGYLCSEDL